MGESFFCECFALSSTRIYLQIERNIINDPCDNRLIRFNNCMQLLSCICYILAMIDDMFSMAAMIVDFIADVVYAIISGCMIGQMDLEMKRHPTALDYGQ